MKTIFPKELFTAKFLLEILIAHMDGAKVDRPRDPLRYAATNRLIGHGMLKVRDPRYWEHSLITERGREKLAELLADYFEVLQRAETATTERLARAAPDVECRRVTAFGPFSYLVPPAKELSPVAAATLLGGDDKKNPTPAAVVVR
jgi:hypothetical protein